MRTLNIIHTIAAGMALALSVSTAHAGGSLPLYYETNSATPQATATIPSGGVGTGGGLCAYSATLCPGYSGYTVGTLTNGGIALPLPTVAVPWTSRIANYQLNFTISGLGANSAGSIWDITLLSGSEVQSLGYTTIIGATGIPTGEAFTAIVAGNGNFTIGVTDLLEQYEGVQDTLPGFLGVTPYYINMDGAAGSKVGLLYSPFALSIESVVYDPEPASITLFIGGVAALGALRRRRAR